MPRSRGRSGAPGVDRSGFDGERSVTIKDIAEHLGVSAAAVSRALNDRRHTSEDMKQRVRTGAQALGYVPNSAARAIRREHSQLVGLVIPDLSNQIFAEAANVLADRCRAAGFQLVVAATQRDAAIELKQVEALRELRVAGVVISPCGNSLPETRSLLRSTSVVQLSGRNPSFEIPTIAMDDRGGARKAVGHLISLGHTAIAIIGGLDSATDNERLAGAAEAMQEAGLRLDPSLVIRGPLSADFARQSTSELLQRDRPPTALLATSSVLSVGMIEALRRASIEVPGQISAIGFGNSDLFRLWGPGLTAVQLPIHELVDACALQLFRIIEGREGGSAQTKFSMVLDTSLILRGSTGPAPSPG